MKHAVAPRDTESIPLIVFDPPGTPRGAIVVLHEIFGANAAMQAEAGRWAKEGYLAVLPDLYFRQQPGVALGYDEAERSIAIELWGAFDVECAVADIRAVTSWVRDGNGGAGSVGVIGFCLGGQLAILSADTFDAAAAFYPVKMADHEAELRAVSIPLQVHCGTADPHISGDAMQAIERGLEANPAGDLLLYEGAGHAFYNEHRPQGFMPEAARQARLAAERLFTAMAS